MESLRPVFEVPGTTLSVECCVVGIKGSIYGARFIPESKFDALGAGLRSEAGLVWVFPLGAPRGIIYFTKFLFGKLLLLYWPPAAPVAPVRPTPRSLTGGFDVSRAITFDTAL